MRCGWRNEAWVCMCGWRNETCVGVHVWLEERGVGVCVYGCLHIWVVVVHVWYM